MSSALGSVLEVLLLVLFASTLLAALVAVVRRLVHQARH
jgi:hypothetical protein